MNESVSYESTGDVATITIRRANKMNALNEEIVRGLQEAWVRFESSNDRVAVLTSDGNRAFCVGADLGAPPEAPWRAFPNVGAPVTKPVIAAVFGHCAGGGYMLQQYCDLTVAADNTSFSYPEAKVGITGGMCATVVSRIPHKIAMEFLLMGESITAQRAYDVGMINRVVPPGSELQVATEMARTLASYAPLVTSLIKKFADAVIPLSPAEQQAHAQREITRVLQSSDAKEGRQAFEEQRPANFKGS